MPGSEALAFPTAKLEEAEGQKASKQERVGRGFGNRSLALALIKDGYGVKYAGVGLRVGAGCHFERKRISTCDESAHRILLGV